jgi:molecular chaperone GrpE
MNDQENGPDETEPAPAASAPTASERAANDSVANDRAANDSSATPEPKATGPTVEPKATAPTSEPKAAGSTKASREAELAAALSAAQAQVAEYKDHALRAMAEAENTRRRTQRDRDEAVKHAPAILAKDILVVADNLRRAIEHVPQEALAYDEALANLATGVEMTERLLLTAFEKHAIRQVNPLGEKFDSNFHQAMFEVPGTGQPQGTVVQVMEPGYLIHDRQLRPALVGVAKGDGAADAPPPADDPDDLDFLDGEEAPPPDDGLSLDFSSLTEEPQPDAETPPADESKS